MAARSSTWSTISRGGASGFDVVGKPPHRLVEAGPGSGEVRSGVRRRLPARRRQSPDADRFAGDNSLVAVVVEQVLDVLVVVIETVLVFVFVVVVGRGRWDGSRWDAWRRGGLRGRCGRGPRRRVGGRAGHRTSGCRRGARGRRGAKGNEASGWSGAAAPRETRAAMSRAMEVLPDEGYPAMRVSLPRGMRSGQSQSVGCWIRNLRGWSPASLRAEGGVELALPARVRAWPRRP